MVVYLEKQLGLRAYITIFNKEEINCGNVTRQGKRVSGPPRVANWEAKYVGETDGR